MSLVAIPDHEATYIVRMGTIADIKAALLYDAPENAIVLDYGCGAGDVIQAAQAVRPDLSFVGYDYYPSVVQAAHMRNVPKSFFTSDEKAAFVAASAHDGPKVLFMSSVMHEIVSIHGDAGLDAVLDQAAQFDQIVMRDMAFDPGFDGVPDSAPESLVHSGHADALHARWGGVNTAVGVAHLMLKARYKDNWDAELAENYLPYSVDDLISRIRRVFPIVRHVKHELPAFLEKEFMRVYGRTPLTRTHVEIICDR